LGVRKGHTILIWGYAEGYNFDLGVRGYQKVENPWSRLLFYGHKNVVYSNRFVTLNVNIR